MTDPIVKKILKSYCVSISGHYYCIGECGGATQEGKCPECGSQIGGTQHRLRSDNALAPEMDGARFAAWSDTANNMGNWDLRQLRQ